MSIKKQPLGIWVNLLAAILAVISLVVYNMNVAGAGYFHNARVSSVLPYGILAVALLAMVMILAQVKFRGSTFTVAEVVSGLMRIAVPLLLAICLIDLIAARAEGLGFIYFSNADVILEVQTPANLSSATGAIANMICLAAATVMTMIAAFFRLNRKNA